MGKEVTVTQWPMGDWESVSGEGFDDDTTEEMKLDMVASLVSSAFHNWSHFREKPSCNQMSLVMLSVM